MTTSFTQKIIFGLIFRKGAISYKKCVFRRTGQGSILKDEEYYKTKFSTFKPKALRQSFIFVEFYLLIVTVTSHFTEQVL